MEVNAVQCHHIIEPMRPSDDHGFSELLGRDALPLVLSPYKLSMLTLLLVAPISFQIMGLVSYQKISPSLWCLTALINTLLTSLQTITLINFQQISYIKYCTTDYSAFNC